MKVTAVIAAGGKGTRMGADKNKVFLSLLGKEVLYHTISAFENNRKTDEIVIVTAGCDMEKCCELVKENGFKKVTCIAEGGASRQESVLSGLKQVSGGMVLIHDGARALITDAEIDAVIADCEKYGAAALGVPCKDTLKAVTSDGFIQGTIDRDTAYLIQTPQAFYLDRILDLHKRALAGGFSATDDCMIAEHYGQRVKISAGSYDNIKLTTPEDMIIGEEILRRRK